MTTLDLIKSDLFRHTGKSDAKNILLNLINSNRSFKYTFWLRLRHHNSLLVRAIARAMHKHLSIKYQVYIPKEVEIGPGLNLGHTTSIVINATAKIGCNCNISHFVTIGSNHGQAAHIGDNCYIGPNSCLIENIIVGDNVTIGAGTIATKDIPSCSTAVGNPAKHFPSKTPAIYIKNKFTQTHLATRQSKDDQPNPAQRHHIDS